MTITPNGNQLAQEKENCRLAVLAKRRSLSPASITASDSLIEARVVGLELFANARTVFCFVSTEGEVNTQGIILEALAQGKRVCLPRCKKLGIMDAYEIESFEDIAPGMYDIPEPASHGVLVPPEEIGFAIVPCVSCSKKGERLGYGGGFYDRYLIGRRYPAAALCREALLVDNIPLDIHDVTMDIVITEMETIVIR